jgi:hypothetical protein
MVAYASKGQKLSTVAQTNIYTVNTTGLKDIRCDGEITHGSTVQNGVIAETVFADSNDAEKPVLFNEYIEDAFSFSHLIRMAATAGSTPFLVSAFESGGYTVAAADTDSTIATYSSTTSFTITDATTTAAGEFRTIELNNGQFIPVLFAADASGGAITPLFALPSATAALKPVKKTWTITPGQPAVVPDAKFLTMVHTTRDNEGNRAVVGTGCWLSSVGDITVEPGTLPKLELKFSAADLSENTANVDQLAAANEFLDAEPVKVTDAPYVMFNTYSAAGGIAAAYAKILKATISLGKTCEAVPGMGDATGCLNNIQAAMGVNAPCAVTLEMLIENTKITDWDAGTNASKSIAIIQPSTSVTVPAWALQKPCR